MVGRFTLIILSALLIPMMIFSQSLPSSRGTDWSLAGLSEEKIDPSIIVNFLEEGGINDGASPNDSVFQEVLRQYSGNPMILYFPVGRYVFQQALHLPDHFILRGEGADSTVLLFDLQTEDHLIQIRGKAMADTSYLIADAHKDDLFLILDSTATYQPGDYLKVLEEDDHLIISDWARYSSGQLLGIQAIRGDTMFLDQPLRQSFSLEHASRVIPFSPSTQVGIEQIGMERLDETSSQSSNILMEYAANCWLSCIRSDRCNFAHVEIRHSTQIDVSGSHFERAFSYGNGGKAYGVMLHYASGNCLIRNNSFRSLRHAMILQAGANGNVLAYNYSSNPYWTGVSLPTNSAGDLVLHGNYPYANLLEGNVVQNIVIDNSHGINGPHNTFFRNRAELYGLFMNSDPASDGQNFLGNEIPNEEFLMGNYLLAGKDHLEMANNVRGILMPTTQATLPENSLFENQGPSLLDGPADFPLIGHPNLLNAHTIEAQVRFEAEHSTACDVAPTILASKESPSIPEHRVQLYPNPARDRIQLDIPKNHQLEHVEVLSSNGQILLYSQGRMLEIGHLPAGIYFTKAIFKDGRFVSKKWVKE